VVEAGPRRRTAPRRRHFRHWKLQMRHHLPGNPLVPRWSVRLRGSSRRCRAVAAAAWPPTWLRGRSWVTRDAGDERAECEEGEGIDGEQVRDEVARCIEGQAVVVEENVHDRRMWREVKQGNCSCQGSLKVRG
jgi:hypothetical protein